ncbi:hypothetical protein QQ045_032858 [Rhodiola kirilowii]
MKGRVGAVVSLALLSLFVGATVATDWSIISQNRKMRSDGLQISLKNYCESWRMNVELHNIRDFEVVPEECTEYIGKYFKSTQYTIDSERTLEECVKHLTISCSLKNDGKDAWIFDIDDTLLSTLPYYKKHNFGGEKLNLTSLEEWKSQSKAPALAHSVQLFNELKSRGVEIFLISARNEKLRSATIDNLVNVGIHGWTSLILRDESEGVMSLIWKILSSLWIRGDENECKDVVTFKAGARKDLLNKGYRLWGIVGDQWSSILGSPTAKRTFKLPNPVYYVA